MKPEVYWPKELKTKSGTRTYLRGRAFYYDFEWSDVFPSSKEEWSRFPGMKTVSELVEKYVQGEDWSNVNIILTTQCEQSVSHQEIDKMHFFVFDAERLKNRTYSATNAFLGGAASSAPEMLDAYQLYRNSPEALRRDMLAADAPTVLSGLTQEEARALLPMALGLVNQAAGCDWAKSEVPELQRLQLGDSEFAELVRALHLLVATAQKRGDVAAVLSILDGLSLDQRKYFKKNPEIVKLVAEKDISTMEVTSWAYRRRQVELFEGMLEDISFVEKYKQEQEITKQGEEPAWQHFFEQNRWIFGLALNYHFNEAVSKKRLEVYAKGATFLEDGKRPDAVMANVALIRSLCFVEIKTPRKKLLGQKYRDDVWSPSDELAGAVAQSQKAVYRSVRDMEVRFRLRDDEGAEHGESIYTVYPRSYVVIGRTTEFLTKKGTDKEKLFTSFELYRRSIMWPEVITFDELLERARRLASPHTLIGEREQEAWG